MAEINLITGNANKIADITAILTPSGIIVRSQSLDLPEIQGSIEEITVAKCRRAAEMVRFLPHTMIQTNAFGRSVVQSSWMTQLFASMQ